MKCEKCGIELKGSMIVCRACKHNNAMQRVSAWRAKREAVQQSSSGETTSNTLHTEFETNLLQFPFQPESKQTQTSATGDELENAISDDNYSAWPAWRVKVKEKVREAREKRLNELLLEAGDQSGRNVVDPNQPNPIVAAALNRIQRASHSASTNTVNRGALATALVKEEEPDRTISPSLPASPAAKDTGAKTEKTENVVKTVKTVKAERNLAELKGKLEARNQASRATHTQLRISERDQRKTYTRPTIVKSKKHIKTQIIEIPRFLPEEESDQLSESPTLWVRTLAGACDLELIATAYLPIFAAYASLQTTIGREASLILLLLLAAITFLYQFVSLFMAERTCGMAVLRLRLVRTDVEDQPISRGRKLLRALAATIAFICPPLNLLVMRLNTRRLSLPDVISGTLAVEE
jgi:uncharacterized RDD family membrane protein YckC